ncbi:MAG: fumarylacetoacetate hydrolase family protein [Ignavibacteriaceae bacterium]|nr:fumarylacetoacetate hydrolase family protein [Ignavibacteriaceae bacterium]NUM69879.1 fumarylacetoacetate hydrolase family protein [Ignavibacteriaceae bacterium]
MKFVSYLRNNAERAGLFIDGHIVDIAGAGKELDLSLPVTMAELLKDWEVSLPKCKKIEDKFRAGQLPAVKSSEVTLLSPVPHPTSCRDGYAFRQHVETARRNRGVAMIPEFDQYPVFYFTNHNAVFGEGDVLVETDHLQKLDFELECAVVISRRGKNIESKDADSYIAGFCIMNDLSARTLQMEEMMLNLGPAKGKDFATTLGPWLVTPDELEPYMTQTPFGKTYNLEMKAFHNGVQVSYGNVNQMNWTFAEIIERASYGAEIFPGDVIGSGTVGTGCYLELNGTKALQAKAAGEEFTPVWLKDGDEITLEITGMGVLKNKIVRAEKEYSILAKKKI